MDVYSKEIIPYPTELVFTTLRDRLTDIVPYMPNIDRVEIVSREDADDQKTKLVRHWYAKGEIPKMVRTMIKPEMLRWKDVALWDPADYTCAWSLETFFFTENIRCKGLNYYRSHGENNTSIEITGDLTIDLSNISSIPKLLRKKVGEQATKFIIKLVSPNLKNLNAGLSEFLASEKRG